MRGWAPSFQSTTKGRWPPPATSTPGAPRARASTVSLECRSRSRTTWSPAASPRPARRKYWKAGFPPTTRRWSKGSARSACRSSAKPIWTNSLWGPPRSAPPTARRTTPGTSTGFRGDPREGPPQRSPPSWSRGRSARTPAAPFASPPRSLEPSERSRPTGASRATASSPWPPPSTRSGPSPETSRTPPLSRRSSGGRSARFDVAQCPGPAFRRNRRHGGLFDEAAGGRARRRG